MIFFNKLKEQTNKNKCKVTKKISYSIELEYEN